MRTTIVGVGNTLMRDDGIGVHVIRELQRHEMPDGVDLADAGTSADAAYALTLADRVIILDAARLGGAPGTVYRLTPEQATGAGIRSCHDMGLIETLRTVTGETEPEIVIFGVEPEAIDWGEGLTTSVGACVPRVIEIVKRELKGSPCS
jgi:hydrogenase maturation protease